MGVLFSPLFLETLSPKLERISALKSLCIDVRLELNFLSFPTGGLWSLNGPCFFRIPGLEYRHHSAFPLTGPTSLATFPLYPEAVRAVCSAICPLALIPWARGLWGRETTHSESSTSTLGCRSRGGGWGGLLSKDDTAISLACPVLVIIAFTGDMLEWQDAVKSYGHTASRWSGN